MDKQDLLRAIRESLEEDRKIPPEQLYQRWVDMGLVDDNHDNEVTRMPTTADDGRSIFDGYCHRPFDKASDGWVDHVHQAGDFQIFRICDEIKYLIEQNAKLTRALWHAREAMKLSRCYESDIKAIDACFARPMRREDC